MKTKVQMWGNSLAIRIPKPFALEINLEENSEVNVTIVDGQIVVEPVKSAVSLDDLLKRVNKKNLHEEVDWGPAVGKEVW